MAIRYGEILTPEAYYRQMDKVGRAFDSSLDVLYADWRLNCSQLAYIPRLEHALLIFGSNGEGLESSRPPKSDSDVDPVAILRIPGSTHERVYYHGAILLEMRRILGRNPYVDFSHPSNGLSGSDYNAIIEALSDVRRIDRRSAVTLLSYEGSEVSRFVSMAGRELGVRVNVFAI